MDALTVEPGEPAEAAHLIFAHDAFSAAQSPAESRQNLTLERMEGLRFWIARLGSDVVGCGATKPLGDGTEEIKSMHVAESARGGGVASVLLSRIVSDAAERGVRALRLETGSMDAFAPGTAPVRPSRTRRARAVRGVPTRPALHLHGNDAQPASMTPQAMRAPASPAGWLS